MNRSPAPRRRKPLARSEPTRPGTVTLRCPECGTPFERFRSQVAARGARWCSMACAKKGRRKRPKVCRWCGEEYIPERSATVFCSRRCYFANQTANRSHQVELVCAACGTTFTRSKAWTRKARHHYCSRPCQAIGRVRGESMHSRGKGWRKIAEAIRERDGRRCVRCGEVEGTRKLHVDHVLPWRWLAHVPEIANDDRNLASLCERCHGVKTSVVEPRLGRGDFLALEEFYGKDRCAGVRDLTRDVELAVTA